MTARAEERTLWHGVDVLGGRHGEAAATNIAVARLGFQGSTPTQRTTQTGLLCSHAICTVEWYADKTARLASSAAMPSVQLSGYMQTRGPGKSCTALVASCLAFQATRGCDAIKG